VAALAFQVLLVVLVVLAVAAMAIVKRSDLRTLIG